MGPGDDGDLTASGRSLGGRPDTLEEKLERRRQDPNLVPSMFLWKDFGESWCFRSGVTRVIPGRRSVPQRRGLSGWGQCHERLAGPHRRISSFSGPSFVVSEIAHMAPK